MSDHDLVSTQVEFRTSVPAPVLRWVQAAMSGSPIPPAFSIEVFEGEALDAAAFLLGLPEARLERRGDHWLLSLQCVAHDDLRPGLFALLLALAPSSVDGLVATSRLELGDSASPDLYYVQHGTLFVGAPNTVPIAVASDTAGAPRWESPEP